MSQINVGQMGRRANRCRALFQKYFSKREAFLAGVFGITEDSQSSKTFHFKEW